MIYDLFLFDLDDTLLDFKASERLSFFSTLKSLGLSNDIENLFERYQIENRALWKLFEESKTTKDILKVERFKKLFSAFNIDIDPEVASDRYLEFLPESVVLVDHAVETCEWISPIAEIGIVTNGMHAVATRRIARSPLAKYISFICVSETCGFAKPDIRFFEHGSKMAKKFSKASSLVIGDRLETDIQGALNFGIDSCWFNTEGLPTPGHLLPKYEIKHLSELKSRLMS